MPSEGIQFTAKVSAPPSAMAGNRLRKKTNAASGRLASSQAACVMLSRRLSAGWP